MANPRRIERLQQLMLEVIAETVQRELEDPRIGLVTITRIKLTPDLFSATVFWSTLDEGAKRRTTERGLTDALPLLQRAVATNVRMRITPKLSLRFDDSLERAGRLEGIFQQLREERDSDGPTEG